jgi:hypothetical protein
MQTKKSSIYYQATVERALCWFVVACLKTYDHLCFDRTIDVETSRFEFFVPADMEQDFLCVMHYFQQQNLVSGLCKMPNRLTE